MGTTSLKNSIRAIEKRQEKTCVHKRTKAKFKLFKMHTPDQDHSSCASPDSVSYQTRVIPAVLAQIV